MWRIKDSGRACYLPHLRYQLHLEDIFSALPSIGNSHSQLDGSTPILKNVYRLAETEETAALGSSHFALR